jgi:hypothetical protein
MTVTQGTIIVVAVSFGLASTPTLTCTDAVGNSYQKDKQADKNTNSTPHVAVFSAYASTALAAQKINVASSPNFNSPTIAAYYITGADTSSWLDTATSAIGSSTAADPTSLTTSVANELVFGAMCYQGVLSDTANTAYARLDHSSAASNKSLATEYLVASVTGSYDPTWTLANVDWSAVAVSYKIAPTPPTGLIPFIANSAPYAPS